MDDLIIDDLISKQDVLNLCDMRDKYKIPYEYDDGSKHIKGYDEGRIINVTKLKMLPSVNLQEKIGYWIRFKEFENGYYHIKCSECGQYWSIDGHAKIFKYCFNCGAKMEVEQNG